VEMVYRERWEAEIAEMRRVLAGLAMKEMNVHARGCGADASVCNQCGEAQGMVDWRP
jgi:hypothetical protein